MEHAQKIAVLQSLTQDTVYLVGTSFIVGSLFTILVLIIFDWIKYARSSKKNPMLPK